MTEPAWTRPQLEAAGFTGWVPWSACPPALAAIPTAAGGVYLVYRTDPAPPQFLSHSPAGTAGGRGDRAVDLTVLTANWVRDAAMVYLGKADHGQLRRRLRTYARFGRGDNAPHWGGRLIWQLADAEQMLVAWRVMPPSASPLAEETRLLQAFRLAHHGHPPFANNPDLLGR